MLCYHLCLGISSCLLPSGFPTKVLHEFLISPIHATYGQYIETGSEWGMYEGVSKYFCTELITKYKLTTMNTR